jgi:DNA ligase-1
MKRADPTGWWVTEAIEGDRVLWDGQKFVNAGGKPTSVSRSITSSLPNYPLEGILKQKSNESDMEFYIVDSPQYDMLLEDRMSQIKETISSANPNIKIAMATKCLHADHLKEFTLQAKQKGAKGVWLKRSNSFYHQANSFMHINVRSSRRLYWRFNPKTTSNSL